jgi:transcriptional regulator with XRE-family HTH domain
MVRLDKGLSQFNLAELSGLSEGQISNIERGRSWIGELSFTLLARALGVSQQSLFDYSGNEAFVKNGGLARRAPRKPAKLIVNRRREVSIQLSIKNR